MNRIRTREGRPPRTASREKTVEADHRMLPTEAEIAVLEALVAEEQPLVAKAGPAGAGIAVRLVQVDPVRQFLVVAAEAPGEAASDLAKAGRIELSAQTGDWLIAFSAEAPRAAPEVRAGALRLRFPQAVTIRRARQFARAAIDDRAVRCIVRVRSQPELAARVTDISEGGVGLRFDHPVATLEPGTILLAARFERPGVEGFLANLEVRHTAVESQPGGERALRVGCRFVSPPPAAIALARELVGRNAGASPR